MTTLRRRLLRWPNLTLVLVLIGTSFIVVRLNAQQGELLQGDLLLLVPATLLIVVAILGWALGWSIVLHSLDSRIGLIKAVTVFLYTWLGRYVPGTLPYHAARFFAADSLGTSKSRVGASIAYETVFLLGSGGLIGCLGVLFGLRGESSVLYPLMVVPLVALPIVLHPRFMLPLANRAFRLVHRPEMSAESLLSGRQTAVSFLLYLLVHAINGVAFVLVLVALQDESPNVALAIGAYALGGTVGSAAIFVPSGIGVREGVIVALLSSTMDPEQALLAATTARILSLVADLVPPVGLALFALSGRIRRQLFRTAATGQVAKP